jgi:hypothetical protein
MKVKANDDENTITLSIGDSSETFRIHNEYADDLSILIKTIILRRRQMEAKKLQKTIEEYRQIIKMRKQKKQ